MEAHELVRPMSHKGLPDSDCHIISFVDQDGRPGMVGVLMPGVHSIGAAEWDMEIYAVSGTIRNADGKRLISQGTSFTMTFPKGGVVHLRVEAADGSYPAIFRAYAVRK